MANKFSRPGLPYQGQARPNNTRYELITQQRRPPTAEMLDGEMNYVVDSLNTLEDEIEGVRAGNIPGSNVNANKDKLLTTDGKGTLSWVPVRTPNIEDQSVTSPKIQDQAVTRKKLGDGCVTTNKIYDQNVTEGKIKDKAITSRKINDSSVTRSKLSPLAVNEEKIASQAIITAKIKNGAVTTPKLADSVVTEQKLANASVTEGKVALNAVTTPKIQDLAVTTAKIDTVNLNKVIGKANKLLITGDDKRGASIDLPQREDRKVLISKKSSPYLEFRDLEAADLPQIGMQPVYLCRWQDNGTLITEYNPFGFKTGWSKTNNGQYTLSLNQVASNFILVATLDAAVNASGVVYTAYSGNNIIVHTFKVGTGHIDYGGQLVLYKVA